MVFKAAYVRACSAINHLTLQEDRLTAGGRVRTGQPAGAGRDRLATVKGELARHLRVLSSLHSSMPFAVRQWTVPTVGTAGSPGAFPAKLGDIHFTNAHDLAALLQLRNRRERLREHIALLTRDVSDGIATVSRLVSTLTARLTALGRGDVRALENLADVGSLFGRTAHELDQESLFAYGRRVVFAGRREAAALLGELRRLQAGLAHVPANGTFVLQQVTGRTVWEREGGRMLRGEIPPEVWAVRAGVITAAPSTAVVGTADAEASLASLRMLTVAAADADGDDDDDDQDWDMGDDDVRPDEEGGRGSDECDEE